MLEGSDELGVRAAKLSAAKNFKVAAEDLALCDICGEGDWEDDNKILFCDSCNVGVHQDCYGAGAKRVPSGPWYCDACTQGRRTSGKQPALVRSENAWTATRGRLPSAFSSVVRRGVVALAGVFCAHTDGLESEQKERQTQVVPICLRKVKTNIACRSGVSAGAVVTGAGAEAAGTAGGAADGVGGRLRGEE